VSVCDFTPDIKIYPTSWYCNACVQGFLEVLAWGLGEEGEQIVEGLILQSDGRAVIPADLAEAIFSPSSVPMPDGYTERPVPDELGEMKRIAWWWAAAGYRAGFIRKDDVGKELDNVGIVETVCRSLFHKSALYPNLAQLSWDKMGFLNAWFTLDEDNGSNNVICSFCGQKYNPDAEARVYDAFFTRSLSIALGNGPGVFPNLFWDGNPSLTVCKKCRSYFLCFHLVQRNRFYINSDSLQVNWYLNRLLAGKLRQNRFAYQTALLDALQYDPQLRRGVGSWGLQNLEIIVFEGNIVHYYPLSPRLAKMFLVPQISSNLSRVSNQRVWDVILKEQFDYLPTIIYKSLRVYLTKDNSAKDPEVVYDASRMEPLVALITLCMEILRLLLKERGDTGMSYINIEKLRGLGASAPLTQDDNLIFRLLELTRLNRRADVYHLLLRVYVARNMEFPKQLAQVFNVTDPELFKTAIYAYISGLRLGDKAEASAN
jgi:CRISPR-associated protein Cst1